MDGVHVPWNFAAEAACIRSIDDPQAFLKTDVFGVYTLLEEARRQKQLKNLSRSRPTGLRTDPPGELQRDL